MNGRLVEPCLASWPEEAEKQPDGVRRVSHRTLCEGCIQAIDGIRSG
jgi:hypothetical protein